MADCGCNIEPSREQNAKALAMGLVTFQITYCPKHDAVDDLIAALGGLMEIAEMAMPDSFFLTDRRVKAAQDAIRKSQG